ncbi:MAG TPA: membrane protein insertion efficiency factor YidD [Candidatus Acidoferrales bacterium]|nr:membrane protein insertion efficiency factor YidD [Candidatus Acidoferrales bacterium]
MRYIVMSLLRVYQMVLSPMLPSACRYYPSCSEYMRQAVGAYGVRKGVWMGLRRLGRCHPLHHGGYDPVP